MPQRIFNPPPLVSPGHRVSCSCVYMVGEVGILSFLSSVLYTYFHVYVLYIYTYIHVYMYMNMGLKLPHLRDALLPYELQ